ncbi:MAG: D-Ala-D-Ala carboxypeptidase family metallohydrolase [Paludibacteraceae bacterium]|nr:D-Ala-D-Ala carboxypeptidase family metallohydrolase [Paludibacteraceae bacterium]
MKHFKFEEFRCRCCGGLPPLVRANIEALVDNVLDPARQAFGGPVSVNSGYRCPRHNAEVGGAANSQHIKGEAADIRCDDIRRLKQIIIDNGRYDQLIDYETFLHVSWKRNGVNRKMKFNK